MPISGYLKQQCLNEAGLYDWVRNGFELHEAAKILEISAADSKPSTQISLQSAKCAKEWSFSSAIAGFGFDIIWSSGKIWSFLADNEEDCTRWVTAINESIQHSFIPDSNIIGDSFPTPQSQGRALRVGSSATSFTPNSVNRTNVPPFQSSVGHDVANSKGNSDNIPRTVDLSRFPRNPTSLATSSTSETKQKPALQPFGANLSAIAGSETYSAMSASDSSPDSVKVSTVQSTDAVEMSGRAIAGNLFQSALQTPRNPGTSFAERSSTSATAPAIAMGENDFHQLSQEYELLRLRYQQLSKLLVATKHELDDNKTLFEAQMQKKANTCSDLEIELFRTKETLTLLQQSIRENENRQLRSSAESLSTHEAAMRSALEQHRRELACVRDELTAERKRFSSLVSHESELRLAAEGREITLKMEKQSLEDALHRKTSEIQQRADQQQADNASWNSEREMLIKQYEEKIKLLAEQNAAAQIQGAAQLTAKVSELNDRFRISIQEMEHNCSQRIVKEMDGQLMRELSTMQKKCTKDVEQVRSEQRRLSAAEIEKLKTVYTDRERQTAEDLLQLERLHADRIQKLESKNAQAKTEIKNLEETIVKLQQSFATADDTAKRNADRYNKVVAGHVAQADVIRKQLEHAHRDIQEAQSREASYREKMAQTMEEVRILRAEMLEAHRLLSTGSAQTYQWRQAASNSDITNTTTTNALQIAKDEVNMLEHEMSRLRSENQTLRDEIDHMNKIVYGSSTAKKEASRSRVGPLQQHRAGSVHSGADSSVMMATPADVRTVMSAGSLSCKDLRGTRLTYPKTAHSAGKQRQQTAETGRRRPATVGAVPSARGCSRSPTRCWAAATAGNRENEPANDVHGQSTSMASNYSTSYSQTNHGHGHYDSSPFVEF